MMSHRKCLMIASLFLLAVCSFALIVFRPRSATPENIREYLKQVVESRSMSVILYAEMACDASARGDLPDMEDSFNIGRQRQVESIGVLWLLQGIQYAEMGKHEKALAAANSALEHWPTHIESFAFKIHCLAVLKKTNRLAQLLAWYQQNQEEMSTRDRLILNTAFGKENSNNEEESERGCDPFLAWLTAARASQPVKTKGVERSSLELRNQ